MEYTIYSVCTGGGTITLRGDDSKAVRCDGLTHRWHVFTRAKSDVVPIRPHGSSVRWSVAVVDTEGRSFTTPG
ncbi:hypothetical protein [Micromonospora psammae]|uniref:hypothetical protein n=1 Tax=Micromonospora sp. CPCC 205556 TaxID=3122398 RepID=UPI002FF393A3